MGLFNKKKDKEDEIDDDLEVDEEEPRRLRRKFKDLNPENKRSRKEPPKPWGKSERLFVLAVLLITVMLSGFLALSARNFKLAQLPQLKLKSLEELNPFKEQLIIVGNKGSKISQQKIENTKKLFKEETNNYSGIYAFYIYDLNGEYYYGLNYNEVMQAASLIKLPVMYLAMKNGEDKTLIESMGKRSDNSAFIKMKNTLGIENINKSIIELGMPNTSIAKNETTPEEVGTFFKKLYTGELLDDSKTSDLLGYMTDTNFEDWLRPGIPSDIKLVHKYGREESVVNDAGIVMSEKPFVIVIMTDGVIESEADELFPKLTKLLYTEHTGVENRD